MSDMLSIGSEILHDDTIIKKDYHTYSPYTQSFGNDDEIRIGIQSQDQYVLPSESYLLLEVEYKRKTGIECEAKFTYNFSAFFFQEIRYEINSYDIDRTKNPGLTTNMKHLLATSKMDAAANHALTAFHSNVVEAKTYNIVLPLKRMLGFMEDYNKVIINAKHELILIRSRNDIATYSADAECFDIKIKKVQWKIPHIHLSDEAKLMMLKYLNTKQYVDVAYRSWDLYEFPQLPQSNKHVWTVKTTNQLNKPRYVVVGFQTDKQNIRADASTFSHCKISDVKLFLNTQPYPYENLNLDFDKGNYTELHYMYMKCQESYYNGKSTENFFSMTLAEFKDRCIFAFDCSRSDESLTNSMVDVKIEITARENIPSGTAAYCLIIHDNLITYTPFNGIVSRSV